MADFSDYEDLIDTAAKQLADYGGQLMPADDLGLDGAGLKVGMIWFFGPENDSYTITMTKAVKTGWRDYGYTLGGVAEARRRAEEIRVSKHNFWSQLENAID